MKPVLIITRPAPDGARFAAEVAAEVDVSTILSPLQKTVPVPAICDTQAYVFTSANGVAQAERLALTAGRAWCVGDRTAQAARQAGFDAISANGNAEDLLALILTDMPVQRVAHIRGREARGDIAPRLQAAGVDCVDIVAYEQRPMPLSAQALAAFGGVKPVIIPLFSPRAAKLLLEQVKIGTQAHVIVMSDAVAKQLDGISVQVLDAPSGDAMFKAVVSACRKLSP